MGRSEIRTSINRNLKHVFETYAQPGSVALVRYP
jgi:hypothetical protein